MKNKLDDAFTDHPPILADGRVMKPLSEMVYKSILDAGKQIRKPTDMTWAGLYLIAATMSTFEASKFITSARAKAYAHAACMELSEGEYDEIVAYMDRVIDRRNAAQIEVEETPGKPQPEAGTNPAT
jgi:predicted class III extradiol MEMO1 family dioxygenase